VFKVYAEDSETDPRTRLCGPISAVGFDIHCDPKGRHKKSVPLIPRTIPVDQRDADLSALHYNADLGRSGFCLGIVGGLAEELALELGADLLHRLVLDLAHTLLGHTDNLADLLERHRLLGVAVF